MLWYGYNNWGSTTKVLTTNREMDPTTTIDNASYLHATTTASCMYMYITMQQTVNKQLGREERQNKDKAGEA